MEMHKWEGLDGGSCSGMWGGGLDEDPAVVCGRGWMKILQWYVGGAG